MLEVAHIHGGPVLRGVVRAAGAKNAALPILAAALLTEEVVTLRGVPDLSDVRFMAEILRHQGAEVAQPAPGTWVIRAAARSSAGCGGPRWRSPAAASSAPARSTSTCAGSRRSAAR